MPKALLPIIFTILFCFCGFSQRKSLEEIKKEVTTKLEARKVNYIMLIRYYNELVKVLDDKGESKTAIILQYKIVVLIDDNNKTLVEEYGVRGQIKEFELRKSKIFPLVAQNFATIKKQQLKKYAYIEKGKPIIIANGNNSSFDITIVWFQKKYDTVIEDSIVIDFPSNSKLKLVQLFKEIAKELEPTSSLKIDY